MWKKNEPTQSSAAPSQTPQPRPRAATPASVIGPSLHIKGDLTGQEDLVIQGKVEGEVNLEANNVTVGKEGRIRADIYGRTVHVEGEVKGHLYGKQEVVIRASGKVQGDIVSPRVVLENGSNFKGSIDMEPAAPADKSEAPKPASPGESNKGAAAAKPPTQEAAKPPTQEKLPPAAKPGPMNQPKGAQGANKSAASMPAAGRRS